MQALFPRIVLAMHRGLLISAYITCNSKLPYAAQEVYRLHITWTVCSTSLSASIYCPTLRANLNTLQGYMKILQTTKFSKWEGRRIVVASCQLSAWDKMYLSPLCLLLLLMWNPMLCFLLNSNNPYHQDSPK